MEDIDFLRTDINDAEWIRLVLESRHKKFKGAPELPPYLYRYYGDDDQTINLKLPDALIHSRQWLSSRADFNDPFDSRMKWTRPSEEEIENAIRITAEIGMAPNDAAIFASGIIKSGDGWGKIEQGAEKLLDEMGIACFSETPSSILMWSHYGHHHKGVAVEFIGRQPESTMRVMPICYGSSFPLHVFSSKDIGQNIFRSVLYKSVDWGYELEWRAMRPRSAKTHIAFDGNVATALIFGHHAEREFIQRVVDLLSDRRALGLPDVKLMHARMRGDSYALEIVPLDWPKK